jgi:predicted GNAT family N-acyltransferase
MQIQSLNSGHDRKHFDCGQPELNRWLREMAGQQGKRHFSRTFVLTSDEAPTTILGFYTLSASESPGESLRSLGNFPERIPVVRLGRFAVQKSRQGQGLGKHLLFNALQRIADTSRHIGIAAIVIDAKEGQTDFYCHSAGFIPSPHNPLQLFLLTRTLHQVVQQIS